MNFEPAKIIEPPPLPNDAINLNGHDEVDLEKTWGNLQKIAADPALERIYVNTHNAKLLGATESSEIDHRIEEKSEIQETIETEEFIPSSFQENRIIFTSEIDEDKPMDQEVTSFQELLEEHNICGEGASQAILLTGSQEGDEYVMGHKVPVQYHDALNHPDSDEWRVGMEEELSGLIEKGVFEYVKEIPDGRHAIKSRWVYAYKRNEHGRIIRHKCRLVAKGFAQVPGTEFWTTYAPTARIGSIRLIISLAAEHKLYMRSIDYTRAFCNPPLKEEIYMELPSRALVRLKKTLYGLKQPAKE